MNVRPETEETERDTWPTSDRATVQPPLDIKDRIREAREHLFKTNKEQD